MFALRERQDTSQFLRGCDPRPHLPAPVIPEFLAHRFPEGFKIVFSLVEKGKAEEYAFFSPLCSG